LKVAIPAYTPKDYPLFRQLPGADDMPATWEEWHTDFEASKAERLRRREFTHAKVLIRPGKFKGWLDDNSLSASEHTRQLYAQERLDTKLARREADRETERMLIVWQQHHRFTLPPRRVAIDQTSARSFGLFHAVITGLLFAWLAHHWLG
jgi:hypothetical protein